jgi:hypothetical protein
MVADYNGWTDLPEAEREALDMLELSTPVLLHPKAQNCVSGGCYRVTRVAADSILASVGIEEATLTTLVPH